MILGTQLQHNDIASLANFCSVVPNISSLSELREEKGVCLPICVKPDLNVIETHFLIFKLYSGVCN